MCSLTHRKMWGRNVQSSESKWKIWFLLVVGFGTERMWRVQEQSDVSYGAQDGVWKSYFLFSFRCFLGIVSLEICFIRFPSHIFGDSWKLWGALEVLAKAFYCDLREDFFLWKRCFAIVASCVFRLILSFQIFHIFKLINWGPDWEMGHFMSFTR